MLSGRYLIIYIWGKEYLIKYKFKILCDFSFMTGLYVLWRKYCMLCIKIALDHFAKEIKKCFYDLIIVKLSVYALSSVNIHKLPLDWCMLLQYICNNSNILIIIYDSDIQYKIFFCKIRCAYFIIMLMIHVDWKFI